MLAAVRGGREGPHRIYRQPRCPRCGGPVSARAQGDDGRTTYWCESCLAIPADRLALNVTARSTGVSRHLMLARVGGPARAACRMPSPLTSRPKLPIHVVVRLERPPTRQGFTTLSAQQQQQPITCLIADDHEVVREGLRLALSRAPHIRVVGEASDGEAAVVLAERRRPNVVIMDVRMQGMDGFAATSKIKHAAPGHLGAAVHGARRAQPDDAAAARSGPRATCSRRRRTARSSGPSTASPAARTSSTRRWPRRCVGYERDSLLTAREREILQLLADGMSNADVAKKLFISQETVKSHVRHILAKLEADTRTQAVAIALRESIIS